MVIPKEQGLPVEEEEDPPETADMKQKRDWIISELCVRLVRFCLNCERELLSFLSSLINPL